MPSSVPLSDGTLTRLTPRVSVPAYDRSALAPGVVHISVGSFHRSHQAVYLDDLARRGHRAWGIVGVGLHRREMKEVLAAQDGLFTVVTRGPEGDAARVVGVVTRYLFAPEEDDAVLDALADERTRLVTLTVTPAGYHVDPETGAFDLDAPAVRADLARPAAPTTAVGLLVEALERRRRAGRGPFTVLSCDNVPDNGAVARTALVTFAALRDERLARWIEQHVTFPSSMVDRITPRTSEEDRRWVEERFGVRDRWPVLTEPFSQWIVEDAFCAGRPPLEEAGVLVVDDVRPYALAKTRLLNGAHDALGAIGGLAGLERLDEVMADPVLARYTERLMDAEIAPLVPHVGFDLDLYGATLRERFANPAIGDRLARLRRNGTAKVAGHVLPSIREARAVGRPHELLTLAVAAWCRCVRGVDEHGRALELVDPAARRLRRAERAGGPGALLRDPAFGSLGRTPDFTAAVRRDVLDLEAHGVRAVLAERTAGEERLALA